MPKNVQNCPGCWLSLLECSTYTKSLWVRSPFGRVMGGNWLMFLSHIDASFPLAPPLSLKLVNMSLGED